MIFIGDLFLLRVLLRKAIYSRPAQKSIAFRHSSHAVFRRGVGWPCQRRAQHAGAFFLLRAS